MSRVGSGRAGSLGLGVALSVCLMAAAPAALAQDPSPSPGFEPGVAQVITLGATTPLFTDDFTTVEGWGTLAEDGARIEGGDGGLRFSLRADDSTRWTWHTLDAAEPVLRVGIDATLSAGSGAAGPMCGATGDNPSFFLGVVNSGGEWVLARIVDGATTVIGRAPVPGLDLSDGGHVSVELECAVTGQGGDRLALFVDGVNVADVTDASSFGPFLAAGLYASVATQPFEVLFDDARVLGGGVYAPVVIGGPSPDGSPPPSAMPTGDIVTLGANHVVRVETFDDETAWGVAQGDQGTIAYADGTLRVSLKPSDNALWSWLPLQDGAAVMDVDASVTLDAGQGSAGPMCGSTAEDPTFHYATMGRNGKLTVGTIVDRTLTDLDTFPVAGGADAARLGAVRVRIACAEVGDGTDRVAAWVDGALVADVVTPTSIGPFGKAAIMGSNGKRRWGASFDDLVVSTGAVLAPDDQLPDATPAPTPEPTVAPQPSAAPGTPLPLGRLLEAVPVGFRAECHAALSDAAAGQLEAVICVPAGGAETSEYYRYATPEDLQAAFDTFLSIDGGDPTGTDCASVPSLVDYTISGRTAGQLACYDATRGGVALQWTNRDLLVLAFGTFGSGSYADAFAWWQDAGPNP